MKKLLALLLFVCAAFALTACGGSKIVGEWEFAELSGKVGGLTVSVKAGEEFMGQKMEADSYTMVIEKDGTGSMTSKMGSLSNTQELTWEETEEGFKITVEGVSLTAKIEDDYLVFGQEGLTYKLAKK
jgi:hypothetical protein